MVVASTDQWHYKITNVVVPILTFLKKIIYSMFLPPQNKNKRKKIHQLVTTKG
tara:strand:- start:723 stop:881 length:159 start_codon:yes stop_codon:yes gene_type:complete